MKHENVINYLYLEKLFFLPFFSVEEADDFLRSGFFEGKKNSQKTFLTIFNFNLQVLKA